LSHPPDEGGPIFSDQAIFGAILEPEKVSQEGWKKNIIGDSGSGDQK